MSLEAELRIKLAAPVSYYKPIDLFQHLMSFWQQFALHKRTCDKSNKTIISTFGNECPYPVWHRQFWLEENGLPSAEFDLSKPFFDQLWELAQRCPIPHNTGVPGENCEYTDDWWHSKNCYLCHSGLECEDLRYCYRTYKVKDSQFCISTLFGELCSDVVYSERCHRLCYAINTENCRDSAFLFDCRNCSNCLFCWNLRGAEYCYENRQLSKEEFEKIRATLPFDSISWYKSAQKKFLLLLRTKAWFRCQMLDLSPDCTGNFLKECNRCENSFILNNSQDCLNIARGFQNKDNLDCVANMGAELVYLSVLVVERCFDIRYSYYIRTSSNLEYCGFCEDCQDCFACFGLKGGKFCILNKEYSPEEYKIKIQQIKKKITQDGIEHQFFPNYFSPTPYDESIAGYHFPLTIEEQERRGFRISKLAREKPLNALPSKDFPDNLSDANEVDILKKVFWDEVANRPFQTVENELRFATRLNLALSDEYYIERIKRLFRWVPFSGELRETKCASTGKPIFTQWGEEFAGRILSEEAYEKAVYG